MNHGVIRYGVCTRALQTRAVWPRRHARVAGVLVNSRSYFTVEIFQFLDLSGQDAHDFQTLKGIYL